MLHRVDSRYTIYEGPAPAATTTLEREGFVLLPGAFDSSVIQSLRDDIDDVFDRYPPDVRAGSETLSRASMFRYEMFNRSAASQAIAGDRAILDVIEPLISDECHLIACTAWRNPADPAHAPRGQEWHTDGGPHIPRKPGVPWPSEIPYPVFAIAVHVFLEDCTELDGPTAVIPGSHMSGLAPPKAREFDLTLEYAGRGPLPILARAGDVSFFVSDVWHRRMPPQAGGTGRYFLQLNYARRDLAQRVRPTSVVNHTTHEARERAATERGRLLIGLHPERFYDG
ncbi:MAG: phytanoyl-CoA dioxygenase family protein [Planctomycetota bacterium]